MLAGTLHAPLENYGNGVVGQVVKDHAAHAVPITIIPLDTVAPVTEHVPVMKVDIQGYECEAIRVAEIAMSHAEVVSMEIADQFLVPNHENGYCTKAKMLELMDGLGFSLRDDDYTGMFSRESEMEDRR